MAGEGEDMFPAKTRFRFLGVFLSAGHRLVRWKLAREEGTYQDIVSAPDVWNQIMVELGLSLNVLSFKPA